MSIHESERINLKKSLYSYIENLSDDFLIDYIKSSRLEGLKIEDHKIIKTYFHAISIHFVEFIIDQCGDTETVDQFLERISQDKQEILNHFREAFFAGFLQH